MDLLSVTRSLVSAFDADKVGYALIGGFAVGLRGVARGTLDIDFLVRREDLDKVDAIMASMGYELRHRSENVSQFISKEQLFGEVDFLHAFRTHALRMLERATEQKAFENLTIRVLLPEDLIGLKIQAIVNDKGRERLDMSDIEELMALHGDSMDWGLIGEYFSVFGQEKLFLTLEKKHAHH